MGKRLRAWVLSAHVLTQNVRDLPASTKFSPPRPAGLTLELGQPTVSTHQLCGRMDLCGWLPPVAGSPGVDGVAGGVGGVSCFCASGIRAQCRSVPPD